jgi:hypothetical protein
LVDQITGGGPAANLFRCEGVGLQKCGDSLVDFAAEGVGMREVDAVVGPAFSRELLKAVLSSSTW